MKDLFFKSGFIVIIMISVMFFDAGLQGYSLLCFIFGIAFLNIGSLINE